MATRGAFLAPVLVPMASSFVNLPHAFMQAFLGSPADAAAGGATVLELSWETLDGYVQRVCVAWVGGVVKDSAHRSDVIEISTELARCCGIHELLANAPQTFVGVHVVDALPIAPHVNVEPCTPDDWELIQLHAGLLETELLRQMCVVNDKQVTPIWVHQHVLIRVRASLPVGLEHARLSPNTEVIVAPKERAKAPAAADAALGADLYYAASPPLVVQPVSRAAQNDSVDDVWVHPETLALLPGAVLPHAPLDSQEPPVAVIWSLESNSSNSSTAPVAASEQSPAPPHAVSCSVVRLKCSHSVVRGHVLLSAATRVALDVATHAVVQLRVLRLPEIAPAKLALHVLAVDASSPSVDRVQQAFTHWLAQLPYGLVAHTGTLVRFCVDTHDVCARLVVTYDDASDELLAPQQLEDVPVGALEQFTLLGGHHGFALPIDCIAVETASDADARVLRAFDAATTSNSDADDDANAADDTLDTAALQLARSAPAYNSVKTAIRSVVMRHASATRVLLGAPPPGSVLVHGARGSGKTTLLRALAADLAHDPQSVAYSVVVACRELRGAKMEIVKRALTDAFERAVTRAPAIVVLDDLDALMPELDDGGGAAGPANEQARRLAELLGGLLQQLRTRMWKATLALQRAYRLELAQLRAAASTSTTRSSRAAAHLALLETVASAIARKSVAVVATASSDARVHASLRASGLFDRPIVVANPDAERRELVLRSLLATRCANARARLAVDPTVDFTLLAARTEGYSLRDLASATDRALHKAVTRLALHQVATTGVDGAADQRREVTQRDFVDGIADFQPTALIGVELFKSSVEWADVGGLLDVRTVLKDTLELPTQYAKLYANTPIKLPAGMLLYGPPGCGKTLLASAVAHECGLNFISVKGPEVLNKYIGASEQAIRDLFARAAAAAPAVLFLDEFDSIAPRRGADNTGVTDRLVNQLLTFLDGVEGRTGVYVLAATSRPDMIDPALLRPGRLDKALYCGFPTEPERLDILRAVSRAMELDDDALAYLPEIAAAPKSAHFSGADLQAVMYSAQLELVHEKLKPGGDAHASVICRRHVQEAFESAKPSTSVAARREFDAMYASFSRARTTDFAVAAADTSASLDKMKSPITHQRTALA